MSLNETQFATVCNLLTTINNSLQDLGKKLDYQGKIFEEVFMQKDESSAGVRKHLENSINILRAGMLNHPAFQNNPELVKTIEQALKPFGPGGNPNE